MRKTNSEQFTWPQAFALAFTIIAILASSVLMANESVVDEEKRTTVNSFYSERGRDQATPDKVSKDELAPFSKLGTRDGSALRSSGTSASGGTPTTSELNTSTLTTSALATPNTDFWIYMADVELFADNDRDGYYSGIDLLFDADTYFSRAEVYAVVYLSLEGGVWTEYAVTDDFVINGSSGTDEYVIVSDLVSGYPAGSYDILIELFDAFDGTFVADMGPESTSELAFLPLEDAGRDAPVPVTQTIVVNHGSGGGAADPLTLAILAFVVAGTVVLRRRRQRYSASLQALRFREPSA